MIAKSLLALVALASNFASAAPAAAAVPEIDTRSAGSIWSVQGFVATYNPAANQVQYKFKINENDGSPATQCDYTVPGNIDAPYSGYRGCTDQKYYLNQGYDTNGKFAVLVVSNSAINYRAFYGFTEQQLRSGAVQPDQNSQSQSAKVKKREAEGWTVKDFTWESPDALSSTYHFTIDSEDNTFECTVSDAPASPKVSWDNVPCDEDPVHVASWGYQNHGSAVLTVEDNGAYASFRYANVTNWNRTATPADAVYLA